MSNHRRGEWRDYVAGLSEAQAKYILSAVLVRFVDELECDSEIRFRRFNEWGENEPPMLYWESCGDSLLDGFDEPPRPGPISDSASGGASASGGVDLSGVMMGDRAEKRDGMTARLNRLLDGTIYGFQWMEESTGVLSWTNYQGRCRLGRDSEEDIIRLLPERERTKSQPPAEAER